MRRMSAILAGLLALMLAGACSQPPERLETLEQARSAVERIEREPMARDVAPSRYESATEALARAEEAYEQNEDQEIIEHEAYVALRNAQIAEQQLTEASARESLEQSEAERSRVLLEAREREAEQAEQTAAERGEALEARTEQAREATRRAEELEEQTAALEEELAELQAEETERGWVLTLEDVLFDFDRAALNPGAESTMDRLAAFLTEHPNRNIVIEGHTDATGPATYNQELSRQRADAVRTALMERGVDASRIEVRALGEAFPLASNDTTAGRQLNRRVEVVLSDETGEFEGRQRAARGEPTEEAG